MFLLQLKSHCVLLLHLFFPILPQTVLNLPLKGRRKQEKQQREFIWFRGICVYCQRMVDQRNHRSDSFWQFLTFLCFSTEMHKQLVKRQSLAYTCLTDSSHTQEGGGDYFGKTFRKRGKEKRMIEQNWELIKPTG